MSYSELKRWLYKGNHPNFIARGLNRGWAIIHSLGVAPNYFITMEVVGRKSSKTISFPLAMVSSGGERYVVSMLGKDAEWVKNIIAAGGKATIKHGKVEHVILEEIPTDQRPPILKLYLQKAPGARPHIPVDKDAPLDEFEAIAPDYPVFRVTTAD
ncbi:MAG: nitroreductase/quinone reductase family protein [Chloroflexota bacterium]